MKLYRIQTCVDKTKLHLTGFFIRICLHILFILFSELTNITLVQLFAIGLFFYAWIHQLEAHKIFASMKRKSSSSHSVPHGDWFKYVSCPHYLAEILIYLSQVMILGVKHRTACLIFGWVLTNQIIAGLMSHWWYRKNFKNYPTYRKAVIPFVL